MDFMKLFYSAIVVMFIGFCGVMFTCAMLSIGGLIGLTAFASYLCSLFVLFCVSVFHVYKYY